MMAYAIAPIYILPCCLMATWRRVVIGGLKKDVCRSAHPNFHVFFTIKP